jgi:hypothetical protein
LEIDDHPYLKDTKATIETLNYLIKTSAEPQLSILTFSTMPMFSDTKNSIVHPHSTVFSAHRSYDEGMMSFGAADLKKPDRTTQVKSMEIQISESKSTDKSIHSHDSDSNHNMKHDGGAPNPVQIAQKHVLSMAMTCNMAGIETNFQTAPSSFYHKEQSITNASQKKFTLS